MMKIPILAVLGLLGGSHLAGGAPTVTLRTNAGPLQFAAAEIRQALQARNAPGLDAIILEVSGEGTVQSYRFSKPRSDTLLVTGADARGAMYGGLDVAEAIRFGTVARLPLIERRPHVAERGIKFNIPLDLRTPSYSDSGDSFQANIPEVWRLEFWRSLLDEMARHRFSVLSLWNLHPFPSIVKVPEFPDIALPDVLRATRKFDAGFSLSGSDMFRPAYLENAEVVRQMTIEEKIQFWRDVMQYAQDRGIDVYWFTWNMFLFGTMGQYGITHDGRNQTTTDYFRASVRETVLTYPLLAGMGITAGENMPASRDGFNGEQWLWATYGEGIRDALKQQPQRRFRLIHRFHMAGQDTILREFKDYPGPFDFSYKYSVAHVHSIPNPPFIQATLEAMPPGMKTWLTVRNDDNYLFRWADPDYARDYINNLPGSDRLAGFYMGPDGYCWGREAIDLEPESPRQLVMQKQWMNFMLWGRLSFDPTLPNSHFERALALRFPEVPAAKLLGAWAAASRTLPLITRFYWGDIDLKWYPEACVRMGGFHTVQQFAESFYAPMPGSGVIGIKAWRDLALKGEPSRTITPLDIARELDHEAAKALRLASELQVIQGSNKELRLTLGDIRALAQLGHYYAAKIRGAADLALFDADPQPARRESALAHLTAALDHWKRYAAIATRQYKPQLNNRVGVVDLNRLTDQVDADIRIAREWKPGTIKPAEPKKPPGKATQNSDVSGKAGGFKR
jgi:hypothetical protein